MVCIGGDVLYLYNLFKAYWALCRRSGADQWNTQHFIYFLSQTLRSYIGMTAGTLDFKPTMNDFQRTPRYEIFAAILAKDVMLQDQFKSGFGNLDRDNECHMLLHRAKLHHVIETSVMASTAVEDHGITLLALKTLGRRSSMFATRCAQVCDNWKTI